MNKEPTDEMIKTKEITHYNGKYRNVNFSIHKSEGYSSLENEFNWTHYIFLNLDSQIKNKEIADQFWLKPSGHYRGNATYSYYETIINEIYFNGGCTWYSKESSGDDESRLVKIGCDYQHSWDCGQNYSLEYIKLEVKKSIDSLLEITPVMKWCSGCGVYYEDVTKEGCGKCQYSKDKY